MEPLTVTVSCISLISNLNRAAGILASFVDDIGGPRDETDAISHELQSLDTVLKMIARDTAAPVSQPYPPPLVEQLVRILQDCDSVVTSFQDMLAKFPKDDALTSAKWAVTGKKEVENVRLTLYGHRSVLVLTLELITLSADPFLQSSQSLLTHSTDQRNAVYKVTLIRYLFFRTTMR